VRHCYSADAVSADIGRQRKEMTEASTRVREARAQVPPEPKAVARELRLQMQLQKLLTRSLQAHGFQSDRVCRLAQKLRLSQVYRYSRADAAAAAPKSDMPKPWDDWEGGRRQ
jgi:hypothetical protein